MTLQRIDINVKLVEEQRAVVTEVLEQLWSLGEIQYWSTLDTWYRGGKRRRLLEAEVLYASVWRSSSASLTCKLHSLCRL